MVAGTPMQMSDSDMPLTSSQVHALQVLIGTPRCTAINTRRANSLESASCRPACSDDPDPRTNTTRPSAAAAAADPAAETAVRATPSLQAPGYGVGVIKPSLRAGLLQHKHL